MEAAEQGKLTSVERIGRSQLSPVFGRLWVSCEAEPAWGRIG